MADERLLLPMSHDGEAMSPSRYRLLSGAARETMPTPGAQMSGFAVKSTAVGPDELKLATVSSSVSGVPFVLNAHAVRTHGATPGEVIPPHCNSPSAFFPKLPAAATTVMPLS